MRALLVAVLLTGCAGTTKLTAPSGVVARLDASRDLDGVVVGASDRATLVVVFASWCPHCKDEFVELEALRAHHVRLLGVNYRGHEEYDHRGDSAAVRAFAARTPWLRIVPIDDALFAALGSPPLIPSIYVFDREGALVAAYSRKDRTPPDRAELAAVIDKL
ncbi:MAG: TlpA disulfide reductase family protein [Kofleriaceae bacterium]